MTEVFVIWPTGVDLGWVLLVFFIMVVSKLIIGSQSGDGR